MIPESIRLFQKVASSSWGNPSSIHSYGARANNWVEAARIYVGGLLGAPPKNIVFTSGGTESNNIAILSLMRLYPEGGHIITSPVEHKATSQAIALLKLTGKWAVCHLPVNKQGFVDVQHVYRLARKDTKLISVIHGQSEIGSIQAISRIGQIAEDLGIYFHTDAVQTFGKLRLKVNDLKCDMASVSSHKIQGPQGVGALYVGDDVPIAPIGAGGAHEFGVRPGTVPAPLIAAFGEAARVASERMEARVSHVNNLRGRLLEGMSSIGMNLTGSQDMTFRIPGHLSFTLPLNTVLNAKEMVQLLSKQGIAASPGSACNCPNAPSDVLKAIGMPESEARKGIRFSIGPENTAEDIDKAIAAMAMALSLTRTGASKFRRQVLAPGAV